MKKTYVDTLREMLNNWNKVFEQIKRESPTMTDMEIHNATRDIINKSIGIN
jgi:hypothetical protein